MRKWRVLYDVATLPKSLKSLSQDEAPSWSFNLLPPALNNLSCCIRCPENLLELPKTLVKLVLYDPSESGLLSIPANVWRYLPPILKHLNINTTLFESADCFHALPGSLEVLQMKIAAQDDFLPLLSFSEALHASLKVLDIAFLPGTTPFNRNLDFLSRLGGFKALKTINFGIVQDGRAYSSFTVIRSDTLANLPASLTSLKLENVRFENFGLPEGKETYPRQDWSEGALSRLPSGLVRLSLTIAVPRRDPGSIDLLGLLSHLPRDLDKLFVDAGDAFCHNAKRLVAMLPTRISDLKIISMCKPFGYDDENADGLQPYRETEEYRENREAQRANASSELNRAMLSYYSRSFWGDSREVGFPADPRSTEK